MNQSIWKETEKMLNIKKISIPLEISIYQVQQRNLSVQITLYIQILNYL